MTCFQIRMFFDFTNSLTILAIIPWDFRPRKWLRDSSTWQFFRHDVAFFRSHWSSLESGKMLCDLEASPSSLMLGFLLVCSRCLLVNAILAALCANVGIPSPQW